LAPDHPGTPGDGRYTYIPTIEVMRGLRREGFEPFMVAQGQSRIEGKADFTKHMIRLRHSVQLRAGERADRRRQYRVRSERAQIGRSRHYRNATSDRATGRPHVSGVEPTRR